MIHVCGDEIGMAIPFISAGIVAIRLYYNQIKNFLFRRG